MNGENKYSDIIALPHHISAGRKQMSLYDRAAQFSPFAALTGHDEALKETARLTDGKPELDESEKLIISQKLQMIINLLPTQTSVSIMHFVPDRKKSGGKYLVSDGYIKKFDSFRRKIVMSDKTEIDVDNIINLEIEKQKNSAD